MNVPVRPHHVWRNKPVSLISALPNNRGFGNTKILKVGARGTIVSNGFERGILMVEFYDHFASPPTERVHFNELSAKQYLESNGYLLKPY